MPYVYVTNSLGEVIPGVVGSIVNVTQNQTNAGPGGSVLYPQGAQPMSGASVSGYALNGSGVVGGQNTPSASDPYSGGSGRDLNQTCMSSSEMNDGFGSASPGGGANGLGGSSPCGGSGGTNDGGGAPPGYDLPPTDYGNPYDPNNTQSPLYSPGNGGGGGGGSDYSGLIA